MTSDAGVALAIVLVCLATCGTPDLMDIPALLQRIAIQMERIP